MNRTSRSRLASTGYPAVRRVMGAERLTLDDRGIEALLERAFPDAHPEDVENFMRTMQQFGRAAAPIAQRALPGVAQGAIQGGMMGGPWGALAGGLLGGATSLLGGGGAPAGAAPQPMPQLMPQPMPQPPAMQPPPLQPAMAPPMMAPPMMAPPMMAPPMAGMPAPAMPAGGMAPVAASQLLGLLARPETMQALLALALSSQGRQAIPVGARQVPPVAFANAIAELASVVAADDVPLAPDAAEHLWDDDGRPRGDVANPAARAVLLLGDLAAADAAERLAEADDAAEAERESERDGRWTWEAWDDADEGDPLEAYEHALRGDADE